MSQFILLGVAYAVLFAILVNVYFFTNFSVKIKIFLIFLVLMFSIISYSSIREMQGIPYRNKDFSKNDQLYKILWSGVNEPNKLKKTKGEIFLLLSSTDAAGIEEGDPRLYAIEYNPLLLEKIMEIEKMAKKGTPVAVKLTNLNIKLNENEQLPDELKDKDIYNSLSGEINIELEEILSPSLPKKN